LVIIFIWFIRAEIFNSAFPSCYSAKKRESGKALATRTKKRNKIPEPTIAQYTLMDISINTSISIIAKNAVVEKLAGKIRTRVINTQPKLP
jgi:hypothetical protein